MNSFIKQISDGLPSMDNIIVAPLVRQISWTNNVLIFFRIDRRCVGIILCAAKDDVTVEYALSRTISPTLVSTYSTELIDKDALQKEVCIEWSNFMRLI